MSQRIINCPLCGKSHEIECFHSGGEIKHMITIGNPDCKFETDNAAQIAKLAGLSYVHEQRVRNMEMPRYDEPDEYERDFIDGNE